ncbi:MAG: type II toxin-antitoxin system death-on-curing family toxin [Candidatus Aenigmatarchaeota archaeon]
MSVTQELTQAFVDLIKSVHDDIISATGVELNDPEGRFKHLPIGVKQIGVRDEGSLYSFGYQYLNLIEKHPDSPIDAAAFIIEEVAAKHYFWDGNKRTAFVFAGTFLRIRGIILEPDYLNVVDFLIKVAQGKSNKAEIKKWLLEHSTIIGGSK